MILAILAALASIAGSSLQVQTLNEDARIFPRDATAPRSVFVVTFSRSGATQASAWTRRLLELKAPAGVFQVAVIEDVPRLFRSMAVGAMSRQVPSPLHDHFWVAARSSKEWARIAELTSSTDAHVFVLDDRERIVWRAHGPCTEERIRELLALPPPGPTPGR